MPQASLEVARVMPPRETPEISGLEWPDPFGPTLHNRSKPAILGQMEPPEDIERLRPRQLAGIEALLSEPTVGRAALSAGVGERTLRRWLHDPEFRAAYDRARRQVFGLALGRLQAGASEAVAVLRSTIADSGVRPSDRLAAARSLLGTALRSVAVLDQEERLAALESLLRPGADSS